MLAKFTTTILAAFLLVAALSVTESHAQQQDRQLNQSQQFRMADRIVRVAEPGELADTLNVWGDINSPGRYLVPRNTSLPELISYSFGPQTIRSNESDLDWSKMRVEINVSEYDPETGMDEVENFQYRFNEPIPEGMRTFELKNNQVVSLQVKRRPSFVDYVGVVAPVLSSIATGFLIIERLR